MSRRHTNLYRLAPLLVASTWVRAQTPDLQTIVDRLDRLERENRALAQEVRDLRAQLAGHAPVAPAAAEGGPAPSVPDLAEKVEIQGQRVEEQAQTKVEAAQKFPIRLAGIALFNSFINSRQSGGFDYPTAALPTGAGHDGATMRQTTIGLEFNGPRTFLGGTVHGSVYMDFFTGSTVFTEYLHFRTGSIELAWKNRSIMAGVEKPIFNPREPDSLAQVGISPLTGAGNLWYWIPQVRVEQDVTLGRRSGVRARLGVVQTRELGPYDAASYAGPSQAAVRPGIEGRFELYHNLDDERRIEIAPGFHASTTHIAGFSVPSNLFSLDWLLKPVRQAEFTGAFFRGQNVSSLGTGLINQGYVVYKKSAEAIESTGGWGQLTLHAAPRVDVHLFNGIQSYHSSHLTPGDVRRNLMYGANVFFRLAPNVLLGPEISQIRTSYLGQVTRINNHYDLALGYLF